MKRITILASAALFAISLSFAPATVTANTSESIVFTGPEGEKDKDKKDKKDKKADSKKGKSATSNDATKKCDKSSAGAEGKSGCCSKSAAAK
jgi:hypothetical protein